jgi:hypothetical protein
VISGNQVFGLGPDFITYVEYIESIKDSGVEFLVGEKFEIGFGIISLLLVSIFSSE